MMLYLALLYIGCQNMKNSLIEFLTGLFSNITFRVIFSKVSDSEFTNLHVVL